MKKVFALLLALVVGTFMLAACGSSPSSTAPAASAPASAPAASPAAAADSYKITLITMDQMDQHWVNVDKGCQQAADEINAAGGAQVEYQWFAPDKKDDAKQIEMINNAVADGTNAILLAANGPDAVTAALDNAVANNVTIVYVDSPANVEAAATFATNNTNAGQTAGEEMLKALEADGITSGKIGIVNVNSSTQSVVQREDGFRLAFEGTDFEILPTQYGEGDPKASQDIAAAYITDGVVGIFGTNEGSTVGTGNAIKENGNKIVGVGFDKSDAILGLIDEGSLLCTMAQNPDQMGYQGLKAAFGVLTGEMQPTGDVVDTGVSVITKDS